MDFSGLSRLSWIEIHSEPIRSFQANPKKVFLSHLLQISWKLIRFNPKDPNQSKFGFIWIEKQIRLIHFQIDSVWYGLILNWFAKTTIENFFWITSEWFGMNFYLKLSLGLLIKVFIMIYDTLRILMKESDKSLQALVGI